MMTTHSHALGITLPITTEFQQVAQRFAHSCPFEEKAEQIRRNTLAVCVVNSYLQLMDIPSAIAQGDSWNPMMQMMADVADLHLPAVGVLSCRVADTDRGTCYIPPEAWRERMGYVAVAINEADSEAPLVGFALPLDEGAVDELSVGETAQLALERFEPMETLIDEVDRLRTAAESQMAIASDAAATPETRSGNSLVTAGQSTLTQLNQWIDGVISAGWQATEALLNPAEMGFAFRTAELAEPETVADVSRAKLVDLGLQLGQAVRVALVMRVTQSSVDAATSAATDSVTGFGRSNIVVQVRPLGDSPYLTENLVLTVLDDQDVPFMSATSRAIDNYIQLRLSGQTGEMFKVRVALGEAVFQEQFVI
ncbi:MAG: DUF1822 family protein [Phormidesmis sp.]